MNFDDAPMLPREIPRDPLQKGILDKALAGAISPKDLHLHFRIPGVGFHHSLYVLTTSYLGYVLSGSNCFLVSPEVQKAFLNTSLEGVAPGDLNGLLPKSMYFSFPDCPLEIWGGERTQWHQVGGAFAHTTYEKDGLLRGVTIYVWGMENEKSEGPGDDASFFFSADLHAAEGVGGVENYLRSHLKGPLQGVTDMGKAFEIHLDEPQDPAQMKRHQESTFEVLKLVYNSLLYLRSDNAEIQEDPTSKANGEEREKLLAALSRQRSPKKRRKTEKKLELYPEEVLWFLGSRLTEEIREAKGWKKGHWKPFNTEIRATLGEVKADYNRLQGQYKEAKERLSGAESPKETALLLSEFLELETKILSYQERISELIREFREVCEQEGKELTLLNYNSHLQRNLRWARPYEGPSTTGIRY